ncbi:MAG: thioredoxin [bacterium]
MMEHLTLNTFKDKIFDFENNKDWKYKGDKPCIIDFYADWCAPCKMITPILEEISEEYQGKIEVFKVDTQQESELAAVFQIQSIPSLLFIPLEDKPQMAMGALPKQALEQAITDLLKVEKSSS